jgi:dTDP-4-amino-4,6-dideoxygalactose transaminase
VTALSRKFIPFALPDIGEDEIAEVVDSLRSGWLTTGPKTLQFERDFAERVGARHAVAVNSGTAAMHLALEAMGVGEGDLVITTDFTFTATGEVIRYLGADPVFVDIDPQTFNMGVAELEKALKIHDRVKAVIPVHFAGQACDMASIMTLCTEHEVSVLEDAAHAFPATSGGRSVGSIGDATAFSFYATKTLAVGEGGMLTTDSDDLAARVRVMRLHGISRAVFDRYTSEKPSWHYEVIAPGYKYNLTDVASSLGIHQLRRAETMWLRRNWIAKRYLDAFVDLPVTSPHIESESDRHAWHLFVIQIDSDAPVDRDAFIQGMFERRIGTSVHFIPLHRHPYWKDRYNLVPEQFPVAEAVFQRCVSLPIFSAMTDEDVERVIAGVRDLLS